MISTRFISFSHLCGVANNIQFLYHLPLISLLCPYCDHDLTILCLCCCQIKAFLYQRLSELRNEETLSLQHQVQAVAPFVLQQYTPDAIESMMNAVSSAISLLTDRKTRDLIMILNSKRCSNIHLQHILCLRDSFLWPLSFTVEG